MCTEQAIFRNLWNLKVAINFTVIISTNLHDLPINHSKSIYVITILWIAFCGIVERKKEFNFIYIQDHCQRLSAVRISDTPRAGFEPVQNLRLWWKKLCKSDLSNQGWTNFLCHANQARLGVQTSEVQSISQALTFCHVKTEKILDPLIFCWIGKLWNIYSGLQRLC